MPNRRWLNLAVVLTALSVLAAACTDGSGTAPTGAVSSPATTSNTPVGTDAPVTTLSPPASTASPPSRTTPPAPSTSTSAPQLVRQELIYGLQPRDLATYRGSMETTFAWSGAAGAQVLALPATATGSTVVAVDGRQRILALSTVGGLEIIEDFTAIAGSITVGSSGDVETMEIPRGELRDVIVAAPPPLLVDDTLVLDDRGPGGTPGAFTGHVHPLFAAGVLGPPLSGSEVDVGDSWSAEASDPFLGEVTIEVRVTGQETMADGGLAFVLEYEGATSGIAPELALGAAFDIATSFISSPEIDRFAASAGTRSAVVRTAGLTGRVVFDPSRGAAVSLDSAVKVVLDFVSADDSGLADFTIETGVSRSFVLEGISPATPFELMSVLDRFEENPVALAEAPFDQLTGYEISVASADRAEFIVSLLTDRRPDLPAGTAVRIVSADGSADITAVTVALSGEFRGAPFVAEEVAAIVSGSVPRAVSVAGRSAFLVTIDDEDWRLYNDEVYLYIVIGPGVLAGQVLADLVPHPAPYLWQAGDCLDFEDGFDSAAPYSPFGVYGLRHCAADHVYEVIHSEVLADGPSARLPSDLSARSRSTCARSFVDFTGATELETAVSLIRYLPDAAEWAKGARYLACVVFVAGPDGPRTVDERIDGDDGALAFALDVGTCLSELVAVACTEPHDREIIALFDLPDGPDAPPPAAAELSGTMIDRCSEAFADFELGTGPGDVRVFDVTDMFTFWEFGVRRFYCVAGAFGPFGFALEITGTFGERWREAAERVTT